MKIWSFVNSLLFIILFLLLIVFLEIPDNNLHIITCDVGQGDAILTVYKNIQILTDGGPDKSVLSCLGKYMPFWDRTIELIISTHPDADHSTGIIDVVNRYTVNTVLINPINSGTQTSLVLEKTLGSKGVKVMYPHNKQGIRLDLIHLDILNPSQEQINLLTTKEAGGALGFYKPVDKTNQYSITYVLSFKKFKGVFTGDISGVESVRLAKDWDMETVDYIKVPHHGSRNGLTQDLLEKTRPKVGVISVGKNNSYGHPSPEILKMLESFNIKILRTDLAGDVVFSTDGEKYWVMD